MQGHIPHAQASRLGAVEPVDAVKAQNVDEARRKSAVGHDPDALFLGALVQRQLLFDHGVVAAEVAEVDAEVEGKLREFGVVLRRDAADDAIAALNDLGEHVRIAGIHLKGPERLVPVHFLVQALQALRARVADLHLLHLVAPQAKFANDGRAHRPSPENRNCHVQCVFSLRNE